MTILVACGLPLGELRAKVIAAGAPYVQDVVVAGHDRSDIGVLIFLQPATARSLSSELPEAAGLADIARDLHVRAHLKEVLFKLNQQATGSSNRIAKAVLLEHAASMELGECTDKGSINQRVTLTVRAALVEDMYSSAPDASVFLLNEDPS